MASPVSTRNPLASASLRPAHRSASSTPSPSRGPVTERGADRVVSTSNAAATAASWSSPSGRSASDSRRRTRRHSWERIGESGDDQLVERAGQRGARQFAAGGEELLGDERQAAGPFGDEEQQAGRRPFALDPLDQGRQLVAIERRQGQAFWRTRTGRDRPQVHRPRVVASDDVGLVGADDRESLLARDPSQERRRAPGSRHRPDGGPR